VLLLGALIAGAALGEVFRIPAGESYSPLRDTLAGAGCIILALIVLAVLWRFGSVAASVVPLIVVAGSMFWLGSGLRAVTPALRLQQLFNQMPADTTYGGYRFMEPSLVFYADHLWEPVGSVDRLKEFMAKPGPRLAVCTEREIRPTDYFRWRLRGGQGKPKVISREAELAQIPAEGYRESVVDGFDVANSTWVTLRVYQRP
jgi:hypothetical protein